MRTVFISLHLLIAIMLSSSAYTQGTFPECSSSQVSQWLVPKEWLIKQVTLSDVKADIGIDKIDTTNNEYPYLASKWTYFSSFYKDKDQIWLFNVPESCHNTPNEIVPYRGYVIIRECNMVAQVETAYSSNIIWEPYGTAP